MDRSKEKKIDCRHLFIASDQRDLLYNEMIICIYCEETKTVSCEDPLAKKAVANKKEYGHRYVTTYNQCGRQGCSHDGADPSHLCSEREERHEEQCSVCGVIHKWIPQYDYALGDYAIDLYRNRNGKNISLRRIVICKRGKKILNLQ